jgi:hypothetical protein
MDHEFIEDNYSGSAYRNGSKSGDMVSSSALKGSWDDLELLPAARSSLSSNVLACNKLVV